MAMRHGNGANQGRLRERTCEFVVQKFRALSSAAGRSLGVVYLLRSLGLFLFLFLIVPKWFRFIAVS